jgi:hypothetical protein
MLTPEHRRTPIAHPAPIPFALAPARLTSSAAPAPSVPSASASASAPVTFNNQTYHHLNPSLAAQLAALPPMPTPVRGRGRGRGRATNPVSNAAPGPSRISMQSQVSYFLFLKINSVFTKTQPYSIADAFHSTHFCFAAASEYTDASASACALCCTADAYHSTCFCYRFAS